MNHAWEPIQTWAQDFVTADCGSAAVKVCPTCGYVICSLGASVRRVPAPPGARLPAAESADLRKRRLRTCP